MHVTNLDSSKKEEVPVVTPAAAKAAAVPKADRKKLDMGAIARQAMATAEADATRKAEEDAQAELEARAACRPGKGGLKRAHSEVSGTGSDEQAARKMRLSRGIRWADRDPGGVLNHYLTIEARDGDSRSLGKYKDMQAKEKQMEKMGRNLKKQDSMQKTCEWVTPAKLALSVEVEEASHGPVESKEMLSMDAYTSITSDAAYPDVSLIPPDPSDPLDKESSKLLPPKKVVNIVFESGPVGGSNAAGHTANEDIFEPLSSMDSTTVVGGHNVNATLYASVPEALHFLEPVLIAALARTPQHIGAMLNFDGTPNMSVIGAFRQQHVMQGAPLPPPAPTAPRSSRFSDAPQPPSMNPFTSEINALPAPPPRMTIPLAQGKSKQASIPCSWFNTPAGCQKGDACVYGHFRKLK
jgi:hypothetical protein